MRLVMVMAACIWLAIVAASWAEADAAERDPVFVDRAPAADSKTNGEYDFNWLDPDKKIYVLQNRRYLKAERALLSLMVGPGLSNPYKTVWDIDGRLAYYMSESFGVEAFYTGLFNSTNNTYRALISTNTSVVPPLREIRTQYGLLAHYVPWYAKINVFNSILYFDWYFSAGLGRMHSVVNSETNPNVTANYVDDDLTAFYFGTGHQYYLSQRVTVRLDFTGAVYSAPIYGLTGNKALFSDYRFGIGLGLRF